MPSFSNFLAKAGPTPLRNWTESLMVGMGASFLWDGGQQWDVVREG